MGRIPPADPASVSGQDMGRRRFLQQLVFGGSVGLAALPSWIRRAAAMGGFSYPTGIQRVRGPVFIDGRPAKPGDPVGPGNTVTTGPDGEVIYVLDRSVFLVRGDTRLEVGIATGTADETLRIFGGRVLSVFRRSGKKIVTTPTAVVGIRGSALYVEAEPEKTYLCLCYGKAELSASDNPSVSEKISTRHHESPRTVFGPGARERIVPAPVIHHTDAELILLEAMVYRKPPFAESGGGGGY